MSKIFQKITQHKLTIVLVTLLLVVSGIAHSYNMYQFPYYENDEGTYMSQAWSLLELGELAPYTYWYDHAPAGWILIALWVKVTGGFYTFGVSANSGRVFMLALHLVSTYLVFYCGKKLTRNNVAGFIGGLIFALSPLGIYFQRRVLLDNIMVFWFLLSFALLLRDKLRLSHIVLSSVAFGFAVLTKENAIFFIPGFLYLLLTRTHDHHKLVATIKWFAISMSIVSLYLLYALLKGEFFPTGTLLGGDENHVSLLETLHYQASREGGSILDWHNSHFWIDFRYWFNEDRLLITLGLISTVIVSIISIIKKRQYLSFVIINIFFWIFLMRGGEVIEFYVVPLIPLLGLMIGLTIHEIGLFLNRFTNDSIAYSIFVLFGIGSIVIYYGFYGTTARGYNLYTANQTKPQIEAIEWMRQNLHDPSSVVIIDNYGYVDLQDEDNPSSVQFSNAEWYWKVDRDNTIRLNLLQDNPSNIDIIAMTPQTNADLTQGNLTLLSEAIGNATPIKRFWNDGWGVEFWYTRYPNQVLANSWESYKTHFIQNGRVVDPVGDVTTSEGQSYALLRAVWMDDRETFDSVYSWTKLNLQTPDGTFHWKWRYDGSGVSVDQGSATDGDQDIALSLMFASKQWESDEYLDEAKRIIEGIWNTEVAVTETNAYLLAGEWADLGNRVVINPSYLAPANYKLFSEISNRDWKSIVDTSYEVLQKCTTNPIDKDQGVLPPEWCIIEKISSEVVTTDLPEPSSTEYSYNAFRTPWRIALDYEWFRDPRAKEYLSTLIFLEEEWENNKKIATAYEHNGNVWEEYESVAAYSGNLGYFYVMNPEASQEIYIEKILAKYFDDEDKSYWEDPNNYYTQNWGWFATALYSQSLQNLWSK